MIWGVWKGWEPLKGDWDGGDSSIDLGGIVIMLGPLASPPVASLLLQLHDSGLHSEGMVISYQSILSSRLPASTN